MVPTQTQVDDANVDALLEQAGEHRKKVVRQKQAASRVRFLTDEERLEMLAQRDAEAREAQAQVQAAEEASKARVKRAWSWAALGGAVLSTLLVGAIGSVSMFSLAWCALGAALCVTSMCLKPGWFRVLLACYGIVQFAGLSVVIVMIAR